MSGRVRGPGRARAAGGSGVAPWWPAADLLVLAALVIVGSVLLVPVYGRAAPVLATAVGAAVSVLVLLLVDRFRPTRLAGRHRHCLLAMPIGSLLVAPDLSSRSVCCHRSRACGPWWVVCSAVGASCSRSPCRPAWPARCWCRRW